jgi:hypothetical protein
MIRLLPHAPSFARRVPDGVGFNAIFRKPTKWDKLKEILFGWYLVGGSEDREYFPPYWWLRLKSLFL